jgi:integrase
LKLLLVLARETGHRIGEILALKREDVCLTEAETRASLARAGVAELPPHFAAFWFSGAIFWRDTKVEAINNRTIPISERVRDAVDAYLAARALKPGEWLFASSANPKVPVNKRTAADWLERAERQAHGEGCSVEKLSGTRWHAFRRLWRSERQNEYHDKVVAMCGGWTVGNTREAMNDSYLKMLPAYMWRCVEFEPKVVTPKALREEYAARKAARKSAEALTPQ